MKTKSILLIAAAAFALPLAFVACDKSDEDNNNNNALETPSEIKVAATQTDDTLRISYNGTLDLSTIFSVEQPENGDAMLVYEVERQPDYAENSGDYTSLTAYSVNGSTLTAATGVRVPDALNKGEGRVRTVREGLLKVSVVGVDTLTYTIKMTGKPALTPVISVDPEIDGLVEGNKLVLQTTGGHRLFNATYFTISPIDFGEEDIRVGIGAGDYITMAASGVPQAGGLDGTAGTSGYVVAYYKDNTLEGVLADETLPQARLYVDVEYVAPTEVVGIELKSNIGGCSANSFWRNNANGRQVPSAFVVLKLNNGETRAYDSSTDSHFGFLAGNFSEHMEGRTTEDSDHPGWWTYVALKLNDALPEVGTAINFDVTSKEHFGEEGWTVTVTTQTVAANPGACN
ncbi:MAG: hypothetical protein LBF55_03775 [Prevotellaceae bacterium]|jgi:hypothetical protein|nr:hypothetical protein [Prevotellaceae bacterium]